MPPGDRGLNRRGPQVYFLLPASSTEKLGRAMVRGLGQELEQPCAVGADVLTKALFERTGQRAQALTAGVRPSAAPETPGEQIRHDLPVGTEDPAHQVLRVVGLPAGGAGTDPHRQLRVDAQDARLLGRLDAIDEREFLVGRLGHLFQSAEAQAVEGASHFLAHTLDLAQSTQRVLFDLLELALADDVELPARELRRQAHVLPLAPDGQGQLLVGYDELHAMVGLVDDDFVYFGRLDRVDDVTRRILVVRNDVDLLAAQLLHHRLHARALDTDTCADGVHVGAARSDGNLAAGSGLASHTDHRHDAFVDLRHLGLEQLLDQLRARPTQDDHVAARFAVDVLEVGHDAVAGTERLARRLFTGRQHGLRLAQVDDDVVAALETMNDAPD